MARIPDDLKKTKLASGVTIGDYLQWEQSSNRQEISNFLRKRFSERYIDPLTTSSRHGFAIMAICCLMIETLESFWQGWPDTERKGKQAFNSFFKRETQLSVFKNHAEDFYQNIRCGILHQGETTGGWRIRKKHNTIFSSGEKIIGAYLFRDALTRCLKQYCQELKKSEWENEIWMKLRKKMGAIILNCMVNYFAYGSNMLEEEIQSKAPSAKIKEVAKLVNMKVIFNKKSKDGSGKANIVESRNDYTYGILYDITLNDLKKLDIKEIGYERKPVLIKIKNNKGEYRKNIVADTYISSEIIDTPVAFDRYKELLLKAATKHNFPANYIAYIEKLPSRAG